MTFYHQLWFNRIIHQLRVADHTIELEQLQAAMGELMPKVVDRLQRGRLSLTDPQTWWQAAFINGVVCLETNSGKTQRVAIGFCHNGRQANKAFNTIESDHFRQLRLRLGIHQQWLLYTRRKEAFSYDFWVDFLYSTVDRTDVSSSGCRLIDLEEGN